MARIDWDNSFSVNNSTLDEQHQHLVQLYNNLHESLLHGSLEETTAARGETIDKLIEYIAYHFNTEEELLKDIDYPEFDKHRQTHRAFSKQIKTIQHEIENGELVFTTSLVKLLRNWITDHILIMDKAYATQFGE